jgi:hypothetical protein
MISFNETEFARAQELFAEVWARQKAEEAKAKEAENAPLRAEFNNEVPHDVVVIRHTEGYWSIGDNAPDGNLVEVLDAIKAFEKLGYIKGTLICYSPMFKRLYVKTSPNKQVVSDNPLGTGRAGRAVVFTDIDERERFGSIPTLGMSWDSKAKAYKMSML